MQVGRQTRVECVVNDNQHHDAIADADAVSETGTVCSLTGIRGSRVPFTSLIPELTRSIGFAYIACL